jgi:hypothetical protein
MFPPAQYSESDEYKQTVQSRAPFKVGYPFSENVPMGLSPYEKAERGPGFEELRRRQEQEHIMKDEMERAYLDETGQKYVDESKLPSLGIYDKAPDGTRIARRVPAYQPVTLKASFVFRPLIGKPRRYKPLSRPAGTVLFMSNTREEGTMPEARMPRKDTGFKFMPFSPMSFKFVKPIGVQFLGLRNQQPEQQQMQSSLEQQTVVPNANSLIKRNPMTYWQSKE